MDNDKKKNSSSKKESGGGFISDIGSHMSKYSTGSDRRVIEPNANMPRPSLGEGNNIEYQGFDPAEMGTRGGRFERDAEEIVRKTSETGDKLSIVLDFVQQLITKIGMVKLVRVIDKLDRMEEIDVDIEE